MRKRDRDKRMPTAKLEQYFRVGVADDYILMRRDFPMRNVSPGDFCALIVKMFRQNEKVRHGE